MPKEASPRQHRGPRWNRIAGACQACRRRHIKCDNERPCANCRRLGKACMSDAAASSATTSGSDQADARILEELQSPQHECKQQVRSPRPLDASTSHATSSTAAPAPPPPPTTIAQDPIADHLQCENLGRLLRSWPVWGRHVPPQRLPSQRDASVRSSSSFDSQDAAAGAAKATDAYHVGTLDTYLDAFFAHVHPLNPILDEPEIRSHFSALVDSGMDRNADTCLLLMILAIGARAEPFPLPKEAEGQQEGEKESVRRRKEATAHALYAAAEKRRGYVATASYLTQARCCFYSGVFLMTARRPFAAWQQFLQGLAMCQRRDMIPSDHDPNRDMSGTLDTPIKQAQDSVYWSCWKSERELRFELDLPDFHANHGDFPSTFPSLPPGCSQESLPAWQFYLADMSLWRIEINIRQTQRQERREFVEGFPSDTLDDLSEVLAALRGQPVSWQSSSPKNIRDRLPIAHKVGKRCAARPSTDLLVFSLQERLEKVWEVLTWPFVEMMIFSPGDDDDEYSEWQDGMFWCGVQLHADRLYDNSSVFFHHGHRTWLMEQSSIRSALVLLAVARSSYAHHLPADWPDLVADTINMLQYRDTDRASVELISFINDVFADCRRDTEELREAAVAEYMGGE